MDASTSAVLTGTVVTVGRWSQGKGLEAKVVIGAGVLAIGLSALASSNADFAGKFGTLILVGALFTYAVPIAKALGTSNTTPNKTATSGTVPTR